MKVLASIDVPRLEEVLLESLLRRPFGGLLDPVLVLVPTRRLASHLRFKLLERTRAAACVHWFTYRSLARRSLELALEAPPRPIPQAALAAVIEHLARGEPGGEGEHLRAHAGARAALQGTFAELREAGVTPRELRDTDDVPPFLARMYGRYDEALERLARAGWSDEAGLIRAALPHVPGLLRAKGMRRAVHHGAYDLIGLHLELLDAIDSAVELTFLLPSELEGRAFAHGARLAGALRARGAAIESAPPAADPGREAWIGRLRRLHEDDLPGSADPRELRMPALEMRHAQGAEAELRAAALRALAISREGIPLEEIAIVARSLEPYAPFIEGTFDELRLPFTSSASVPLSRDPAAGALLALLGVLAGDFERRAVIDLLRRPDIIAGERVPGDVDRWERWSRKSRIAGGLAAWRELPGMVDRLESSRREADSAGAAERLERARSSGARLSSILDELAEERARWLRAGTLAEHALFLEDLAARRVRAGDDPPGEAPGAAGVIVHAVRAAGVALEAAGAPAAGEQGAGVDSKEVESLARSAALGGPLKIREKDEGGVRVLDLMQARGLHHRAVLWIGFHGALFPRKARPDAFLGEAARARLRASTGRRIASKLESVEEERLLLAMTLASAGELLAIGYQRAGADGGKEARSSALREVARVFTGRPDAAAFLSEAKENPFRPEYVPAHPGVQALHFAHSPRIGLIPPRDAAMAAASIRGGGPRMAAAMSRALSIRDPGRDAALDAVEAIERFAPGDGAFDGSTGIGIAPAHVYSASAFERLACCPLSFFLRYALHLQELEDEPIPHRIEKRALGDAAHRTLAELYSTLAREGHIAGGAAGGGAVGRGPQVVETALELLGPIWRARLEEAAGPSFARLRGLFAILSERWLHSLREFVRSDLEEMARGLPTAIETELRVEAEVQLEGGAVRLAGFVDRLIRFPGRAAVDDYKTGKAVAKRIDATAILSGRSLQLPLYREVVAAKLGIPPLSLEARLLAVGPNAEDSGASLDADPELRDGILETVAVALRLAREGRFPLHSDTHHGDRGHCDWCAYRRTCRRTHEPTRKRLEGSGYLRDFLDAKEKVSKKNVRLLTLAQVRARRERDGSGDEPGAGGEE